ncbi:MAG: PLDc_N domain-containing protein [Microlunatus sp.]|nr:PLDc_N domain-containing protein [Microlunatus sp.]
MAKKIDLDPRARNVLVALGVAETLLKIIALIDLVRRKPEAVRGKKGVWAAAIATINSVGVVPILYFVVGRRHPEEVSGEQSR